MRASDDAGATLDALELLWRSADAVMMSSLRRGVPPDHEAIDKLNGAERYVMRRFLRDPDRIVPPAARSLPVPTDLLAAFFFLGLATMCRHFYEEGF